MVKESDICITTTGLHRSIGWKFAEYIAASKAIVTEKLNYSPGTELKANFTREIYLVVTNNNSGGKIGTKKK